MSTLTVTTRADLADSQWAILEPLLPVGKKPGRPPTRTKRQLINAIRWRMRVGAPWRDVPALYGPWQTAYGLFRRWQRDGTWREILSQLQAIAGAAGLITWEVSVDSTVSRAHQHAASARRRGDLQIQPPGGAEREPADHGLGRRRGWVLHEDSPGRRAGATTVVGGGDRRPAGDSPAVRGVLAGILVARIGGGRHRTRPDRVLAARPTARAPIGRIYGDAGSGRPSRCRQIRPVIGDGVAVLVAGHRV